LDDEGQIVSINSGSMMEFKVKESEANSTFKTEVSGVYKFFSTYGVYNISGLQIVA
jgi:hypothetical protein